MADPPENSDSIQSGLTRNPKLFVWFRIFLNSRFYYPVYALMFLDFGLSQEQFATLNFAWAISIVLLEVPSGAIADQIGRRPLVIGAAILMIVEMAIMLLMPAVDRNQFDGDSEGLQNAVWILFIVFMINRVISGAAEAAASGADEALAYDSLPVENRDTLWAKLTTGLMKWQAVSFIIVTMVGASLYDPGVVQKGLSWIGIESEITQFHTLKIPILLTLGMAFAALITALRMSEPSGILPNEKKTLAESIRDSFRKTFKAGSWIIHTPAALMLLLIGLSFDSIVRLYYTVGSLWLEVIGYTPFQMGIISVVGSFAGILAASVGGKLILNYTPNFNFRFLTLLVFVGIFSLAFPIRFWSVLFLPALWFSMRLLHFFLSNYLNRVTNAENRATVLSFRGLSMNLTYGVLTWLYGLQTLYLREKLTGPEGPPQTEAAEEALAHQIFTGATKWWWVYLSAVLIALWVFRTVKIGKTWNEMLPGAAKDPLK